MFSEEIPRISRIVIFWKISRQLFHILHILITSYNFQLIIFEKCFQYWNHFKDCHFKFANSRFCCQFLNILNLFCAAGLFLYPLIISKNLWFSDAFSGYEMSANFALVSGLKHISQFSSFSSFHYSIWIKVSSLIWIKIKIHK